jgi:hypothetical protein
MSLPPSSSDVKAARLSQCLNLLGLYEDASVSRRGSRSLPALVLIEYRSKISYPRRLEAGSLGSVMSFL